MDPEAEYAEYDVAEDGAGNFLVYRRGSWYPSNERGDLLQSIPADDWEPGAVELPNGSIMGPRGSRGGKREKIGEASRPDAYSALGEPPSVTAETRGRLAFGLPGAIAARRRMAEMEASGVNPLNRDWGASLIQMVPDFGAMDAVARVAGGQDFQTYDQAAASIEAAVLPIFSGLAVTDSEARRFVRANVPRLGDTPGTLVEKGLNIERVMNTGSWMMGQPIPFPDVPLFVPAEEGYGGLDAVALGIGATASGDASQPKSGDRAANPLLGPDDPATGLPTYPTIRGGREIATPPTGPGSSAEMPIDLTTASRDEVIAAIQRGGWFRQGPDGEPYELPASTPEFDSQPGDVMLSPGVGVRRSAAMGQAAAEQALGGQAAFNRSALEQVPFGDELMAGFAGIMSGQGYERMREGQRALAAYDRQNNRFERNMGGVAGAVAQIPVGMGAASAAPRVLQLAPRVPGATRAANAGRMVANTVRVGAGGGATGALYGAGAGEGDLSERADDAVSGGVLGAVATPIVGAAARPVINNVLAPTGRAIARPIAALGERVGVPGAEDWSRRLAPNVLQGAVDRYGSRFDPDAGVLTQRADELQALGVEPRFINLVDDARAGTFRALNTRDTAAREVASRLPETMRRNLPSRVRQIAGEEVSQETRPTLEVIDQLSATRRANAGSGSQDFNAENVRLDDNVAAALRSPVARSSLTQAAAVMEGSLDPAERQSAEYIRQLASGDAGRGALMTVREVQDITQALNTAARSAFNSDNPTAGPTLSALARSIRDQGRQQSEGYRNWLTQYADDSQLMEAATTGRNFVQAAPDPISERSTDAFIRQAQGATPPEMNVQRAAARQAMEAQGSGPTGARGVLESLASNEDQFRRAAALGVDAPRLRARSEAELRVLQDAQRVSPRVGSETATNQADQAAEIGGAISDVARGNLPGIMSRLGRRFMSRGFSDQQAEAISLAAMDPARTREVIDMLATRMNRQEARSMLRAIRFSASMGSGQYAGDEE